MKYSRRIKESALRKILPPEERSVADVSREMGISEQTIYNWKRQAENGTLFQNSTGSPVDTGQIERYNLLLEAKGHAPDELGAYSGPNLPPIPEQACHLFRCKVATHSG